MQHRLLQISYPHTYSQKGNKHTYYGMNTHTYNLSHRSAHPHTWRTLTYTRLSIYLHSHTNTQVYTAINLFAHAQIISNTHTRACAPIFFYTRDDMQTESRQDMASGSDKLLLFFSNRKRRILRCTDLSHIRLVQK